jgi:hypothetical protein
MILISIQTWKILFVLMKQSLSNYRNEIGKECVIITQSQEVFTTYNKEYLIFLSIVF